MSLLCHQPFSICLWLQEVSWLVQTSYYNFLISDLWIYLKQWLAEKPAESTAIGSLLINALILLLKSQMVFAQAFVFLTAQLTIGNTGKCRDIDRSCLQHKIAFEIPGTKGIYLSPSWWTLATISRILPVY